MQLKNMQLNYVLKLGLKRPCRETEKTSAKKIREIKEILDEKESYLKKAKESNTAEIIIKHIRDIHNNLPNIDFCP